MTITITGCIASLLILVTLIIRFHANVRPDEKYASIGTIPFPAITICPGIRSGYPNKNNFNRTLFLMQTEAAPKLRPRKYEGHSVVLPATTVHTLAGRQACTASVCHRESMQPVRCCNERIVQYCDLDFLLFFFSSSSSFLPILSEEKLHWKRYFSCATGTSFGAYGIGTFWSAMWTKRIKWKHSIRLPAISMRMQKFALGIDAPHATNTFDQSSPTKADATHL